MVDGISAIRASVPSLAARTTDTSEDSSSKDSSTSDNPVIGGVKRLIKGVVDAARERAGLSTPSEQARQGADEVKPRSETPSVSGIDNFMHSDRTPRVVSTPGGRSSESSHAPDSVERGVADAVAAADGPDELSATEQADKELAGELEAYMKRIEPDSPMVGLAEDFVAAGRRHEVDPRLVVALAAHESRLGTAGGGADRNNAFGMMRLSGGLQEFDSWKENVDAGASLLRRLYLDEDRLTVTDIGAKYAPIGVDNDPQGLNNHWVPTMSEIYAQLGGDPSDIPKHWS